MPRRTPGHAVRSRVPKARDQRVSLRATLINPYGLGLIVTAMTLYGIKVVHLSAARTGLALTIPGLVALLASMPIGRLADRRGPRDVERVALLVLAVAAASYVFFAHGFVSYLIVAFVQGLALISASTANVALLRRVGRGRGSSGRIQPIALRRRNT